MTKNNRTAGGGRRLLALAALGVAALGISAPTSAVEAAPVSNAPRSTGWGLFGSGGFAWCDASTNTVSVRATAAAYYSGGPSYYVRVRYQVAYSYRDWLSTTYYYPWSGWSTYHGGTVQWDVTQPVPDNVQVYVRTQGQYWNGYRWVTLKSEWIHPRLCLT